jgi:hypothetical protein
MRQFKSLQVHLIYTLLQAVPAEQHEDLLEKVCIYFPEVIGMFGDVNALYIISSIKHEGNLYAITYWDAGGGDHLISVVGHFALVHFLF